MALADARFIAGRSGDEKGNFSNVPMSADVRVGSNSEELSLSKCLPDYSRKRTSLDAVGMSQRCQERKSRPHSITSSARTSSVGETRKSDDRAALPSIRRRRTPRPEVGSIKDLAKLLRISLRLLAYSSTIRCASSVREGFLGFSGPDEAGS